MKKGRLFCQSTIILFSLLIFSMELSGQDIIEGLIVETYYISDANDASHDDEGTILPEGSITYRIFLDLQPNFVITEVFADSLNPWIVRSTDLIWNNSRRGETLGSDLGDNRLDENTVALDSYFTIGAASEAHFGIPKSLDTDGSVVGGENNDGGSQEVAGGLLVNSSADIGIPLTQSDGLIAVDEENIPNLGFTDFDELEAVFTDQTAD
ncbi:MAG: hypothetical protein AAGC47_14445, partial [Bacteroidota bacterium]